MWGVVYRNSIQGLSCQVVRLLHCACLVTGLVGNGGPIPAKQAQWRSWMRASTSIDLGFKGFGLRTIRFWGFGMNPLRFAGFRASGLGST